MLILFTPYGWMLAPCTNGVYKARLRSTLSVGELIVTVLYAADKGYVAEMSCIQLLIDTAA